MNTGASAFCSVPCLLNLDNCDPNVLKMEYAVRGPIVIRASEIEKELTQGIKKPFKDVIKANIGDAHAMGQKPITYIRQVIALCTYPKLFETSEFPEDVKRKAKHILSGCAGNSLGSYSQSVGVEIIRQDVADYIKNRDGGISSDPDNIILSGGASEVIRNFMKLFRFSGSDGKRTGVMVPIPQYPLYSATVAEYNLHQIGYYLDEANKWALDISELKRALEESRKHCNPRLLCVINPGNPTGQVLSKQNIEDIIKFAHREKLFLFADEVYQDNVYDHNSKFYSFKKIMFDLGDPYQKMELASFHSCSKGYMGECGMRGGYAEIVNVDPKVMAEFKKCISAKLCSTVTGQAVMDCVVNPPKSGDPSYKLWAKEKADVLQSLAERATMVEQMFNSIPGIQCNPVQGAMYAFPRLLLPDKAIKEAESIGQQPDFFYALHMLETSGICVVPGSGFGQKPGTFHFRTTILPQVDKLKEMLARFKVAHLAFMEKYK